MKSFRDIILEINTASWPEFASPKKKSGKKPKKHWSALNKVTRKNKQEDK
jgi:hypothetical protein